MSRFVWIVSILLLITTCNSAQADHLTVLYFDRPPYYLTLGGKPGGFLVDLTKHILVKGDVPYDFLEMPPKRILEVIKNPTSPACSIGWFKTPEREDFAVFSEPIYQDKPLVALFLKHGRVRPPEARTLVALTKQPGLILGVNGAFSYGKTVDGLIAKAATPPLTVDGSQEQLMRMLSAQRFDYMLVNPEEIETLAKLAGLKTEDLDVIRLEDLPKGNLRYLLFSKNTPEETIHRINTAIKSIVRID